MINITMKLGGDIIIIKVDGNAVAFCDPSISQWTTIEGLKLNRSGVVKEFSDLKDDDEWRIKAITRFKEHLKKLKTERQKATYIVEDLIKFGYEVLFYQRKGFRTSTKL